MIWGRVGVGEERERRRERERDDSFLLFCISAEVSGY